VDVETDSREKLNWPADPELQEAIDRTGAAIQQQVAAALAKERRRLRAEHRALARAKAAAKAAEHAANARLPFSSPLQLAAEAARQAALQTLAPFDSVLQRAAIASAAAASADQEQREGADEDLSVDANVSADAAADENLPENMDLTGVPTGILVAPPLADLMGGPFGMDKGAKKPAHLDYPASLLPVMRGRERVKLDAARPYEAKRKRGSKPAVITRVVDQVTGDIQRGPSTKIRRNGKRDNGQSTITRHFAAASVAAAQPPASPGHETAAAQTGQPAVANADPSTEDVELLQVVPPLEPPQDNAGIWKSLLDDLRMTEIATPLDGHCFFSSCYCIKTGVCPKHFATKPHIALTRKEAKYYRTGCYETILDRYETHVHTGLLDEDELRERLNGPVKDTELRARLKDYLAAAKGLPEGKMAEPRYWAGELEIKSMVCWFREPMLVFDKGEQGDIYAWLYHLALTAPLDGEAAQETVTMTRLSLEEATTWLRRFDVARVVPLAIVLRRCTGTMLGNHFNGLRIRAHLYAEWAGSSKKRARMALRRRQLLEDAAYTFRLLGTRSTLPRRRTWTRKTATPRTSRLTQTPTMRTSSKVARRGCRCRPPRWPPSRAQDPLFSAPRPLARPYSLQVW
jgi:hypothetical protein